jgi:hypothetical protein
MGGVDVVWVVWSVVLCVVLAVGGDTCFGAVDGYKGRKKLSLLKTLTLPTFSKLAATLPKNLWQPKPLLAVGTGGTSGIRTGHKIFGSQNQLWQNSAKDLWHCQLLF